MLMLINYLRAASVRVKDERGATAIEYGLLAALIAVVIIGSVQAVGGALDTVFSTIAGALPGGGD